jgi:hypothetical protein
MAKLGLLAAAIVLLVVAPVRAQPDQPDVLPKEFSCMTSHTKGASKFYLAKSKCVMKCLTLFWKGLGPENDCLPPYGGITASCVNDTVLGRKGAENKFEATVTKTCLTGPGANCPECYGAGGCDVSASQDLVQAQEAQFDSFVPGVFCERAGAAVVEQKCQLGTEKTLMKAFGSRNKCYTNCFVDQRSGGDPATCLPPATDPDTLLCFTTVDQKSAAAIDKYCNESLIPDAKPDCGGSYPDGATWTHLIDLAVDGPITPTFCASPSGAFLD